MKAAVYREYGTPDVIQICDIPVPKPQANDVQIRVRASTVGRTDSHMLTATPFVMRFVTGLLRPKIPILGTAYAGTVTAVGSSVTRVKAGDNVFGFADTGIATLAEYVVLDQAKPMTHIPDNVSFPQAVAGIEGAHYFFNFLNKIPSVTGCAVLVNGATGAIGSAAVQLLKYHGAQITAVANSKNLKLVASLGAQRVINFEEEDFTQIEGGYDYVFDTVGKSTFGQCKRLLVPGGSYLSSELGPMAQNLFYTVSTKWFGDKRVLFPYPVQTQRSVGLLAKLLFEGEFDPVIDKTYALDDVTDAFRYTLSGEKTGNLVVTMD